jgi:CheY-like chemotaxis protein
VTILVADDKDDFLLVITEMLKVLDHIPLVARDATIAREIMAAHKVDLIIAAVLMPGLDGVRFHSYVRESLFLPDIPFILVSEHNDPYAEASLDRSASDYFIRRSDAAEELISTFDELERISLRK